jgi:hypothetical protein
VVSGLFFSKIQDPRSKIQDPGRSAEKLTLLTGIPDPIGPMTLPCSIIRNQQADSSLLPFSIRYRSDHETHISCVAHTGLCLFPFR